MRPKQNQEMQKGPDAPAVNRAKFLKLCKFVGFLRNSMHNLCAFLHIVAATFAHFGLNIFLALFNALFGASFVCSYFCHFLNILQLLHLLHLL